METQSVDKCLIDLQTVLSSKSKDESLSLIVNDVIPFCHRESVKRGVKKVFDNYNFRQQQMFSIMKTHWSNVVLNTQRTGKDAWSKENPVLNDIEMKTVSNDTVSNIQNLSFPFDKQNDPKRRQTTVEYDAYVFGVLYEEKLCIVLFAEEKRTVQHLHNLLKSLQESFIPRWDSKIAAGERGGHDAVRLCIKNMLIDDYIWHVWINKKWYKNIKSADCLTEITKFNDSLKSVPTKTRKTMRKKTEEEKATIAAKSAATRAANKTKKMATTPTAIIASPPSTS